MDGGVGVDSFGGVDSGVDSGVGNGDLTAVVHEPARPAGPTSPPDPQALEERGANRSHRPTSAAFRSFIASGWAPRPDSPPERHPAAPFAAARRARLSELFPGDCLVVPAGPLVTRSNDTDYRFRPHSAFAYLTGLGADREPDAVLVMHPLPPVHPLPVVAPPEARHGAGGRAPSSATHDAVLYFRPRAERDTEEFYADARYGELWVGARPTPLDVEAETGITCSHVDRLPEDLAALSRGGAGLRVVAGADASVDALVAGARRATTDDDATAAAADARLAEALAELRLVKDAYEIDQVRLAVSATAAGFADIVRAIPRAVAHPRGERVIEGAFGARAREDGNGVGYETIAAAGDHACTLHWIRNDGPVEPGRLMLVDAGVEVESLYTADVTRTLPVDGAYTATQRRIYEAVLDAADAAFALVAPGVRFRDVHGAAMAVIAARLEGWGLLPVSAAESLAPDGQFHRRWMVHGTSHHLGIDVHDCAQARREHYLDGILAPGMVFTIEPGLYFSPEDTSVPEEYRGIGVRIEDDVLVTAEGATNLTAALPRRPDEVEAWMARLLGEAATARTAT